MTLLESKLYIEDLEKLANENLPFSKLENSSILITGARGLIGSFLIDVIMYLNNHARLNCQVYAMGSTEKGLDRFKEYLSNPLFKYIIQDVNNQLSFDIKVDYVLHLASNTHPVLYSTKPISTITTNIIGTKNLLDYAVRAASKRFLFASSVEIYGENKGDVELFNEDYSGYINPNKLRSGYPESKRTGEALCHAYTAETNLDTVIARLARCYGPTMQLNDSRAISEFIIRALNNENIVLKSEGNQFFSFTYVYDAVYGLLTILLKGERNEAYNIANEKTDIRLKEIAAMIADYVGRKVIFELPSDVENRGYSNTQVSRMSSAKIKTLGFMPKYDLRSGTTRTIEILKGVKYE